MGSPSESRETTNWALNALFPWVCGEYRLAKVATQSVEFGWRRTQVELPEARQWKKLIRHEHDAS